MQYAKHVICSAIGCIMYLMNNFTIHGIDDPWDEPAPAKAHVYESDCLDFVPLHVGSTTRYMSVARESQSISVPVWVAVAPRTAVVDDMEELTYDNLQGAFAV